MSYERLAPGGVLVQENGNRQAMLPDGTFINETQSTGVSGYVAATEAGDSIYASGTSTDFGTSSIIDVGDSVVASGNTTHVGTSAITEAGDSVASYGTTAVVGTSAITEGGDIVAASGAAGSVSGMADITDGGDGVSSVGVGGSRRVGAGRGSRKKRLLVVEIDGVDYRVREEQLPDVLEALEQNKTPLQKKVRRKDAPPVIKLKKAPPYIIPVVQNAIDKTVLKIQKSWTEAEEKRQRDEEEETILWLMAA